MNKKEIELDYMVKNDKYEYKQSGGVLNYSGETINYVDSVGYSTDISIDSIDVLDYEKESEPESIKYNLLKYIIDVSFNV